MSFSSKSVYAFSVRLERVATVSQGRVRRIILSGMVKFRDVILAPAERKVWMGHLPTGKAVTVPFTDMEGSTELACEYSEVWEDLRARYYQPVKLEFLPINTDFEKIVAQAQTQLNESAFQVAWTEGEKMTIEEARDLAIKT